MKHTRSLIALLLVLVLCFSLAACGSKEEPAPAGSADAAENGGMNASNTLVYAGENEDTINPLLTNHDEITDVIFSGLMKYDGNGKPVTDLATEYTYDEATFTYVFKLRDGRYEKVYEYEKKLPFIHAICSAQLNGKEIGIIGHRRGDRDLLALCHQDGTYHIELLDHDVGPANARAEVIGGKTVLVSANREINEVAYYTLTP